MTRPKISKDFTIDDIRDIREYNSLRNVEVSPKEIVADTEKGARHIMEILENKKLLRK